MKKSLLIVSVLLIIKPAISDMSNTNSKMVENPKMLDINQKFQNAVRQNDIEEAKRLIVHGADKNKALIFAAKRGSEELIDFLLDRGVDVNYQDQDRRTALIHAVILGRLGAVELLLDKGASKTIRDYSGKTAYDYAKEKKDKTIEKLVKPKRLRKPKLLRKIFGEKGIKSL